jgi:hypothetical protein
MGFLGFPQSLLANILEKFASSFDLKTEESSSSEASLRSTLTHCRICMTVTTMNCHDNRKSRVRDLVLKNIRTLPYPGPGFEPATG